MTSSVYTAQKTDLCASFTPGTISSASIDFTFLGRQTFGSVGADASGAWSCACRPIRRPACKDIAACLDKILTMHMTSVMDYALSPGHPGIRASRASGLPQRPPTALPGGGPRGLAPYVTSSGRPSSCSPASSSSRRWPWAWWPWPWPSPRRASWVPWARWTPCPSSRGTRRSLRPSA